MDGIVLLGPSQLTHVRSQEWNTPPAFANASNPGYSVATDKLLFVQAVIVDGLDRVWALDTGRPEVNGSYLLAAVPGGPKIVGFYLNGTNFATYTFPANVVYADSSINDVRFDLRGGGYAYLTDSSPNRPGLIVLNMETGESWRHLDNHESVTPDNGFVPVYDGGVPSHCRVDASLTTSQCHSICTPLRRHTPSTTSVL